MYFLMNGKKARFKSYSWRRYNLEESGSYRPLCLLSTLGKLFKKLRLEEKVITTEKMLSVWFHVGKKYWRTYIVYMRNIVKNSNENYTIGILFHTKGAFDNTWWPMVLVKLRKQQCPRNVYNVNYFESRKNMFSCGSGKALKAAAKGCVMGWFLVQYYGIFNLILFLESSMKVKLNISYTQTRSNPRWVSAWKSRK